MLKLSVLLWLLPGVVFAAGSGDSGGGSRGWLIWPFLIVVLVGVGWVARFLFRMQRQTRDLLQKKPSMPSLGDAAVPGDGVDEIEIEVSVEEPAFAAPVRPSAAGASVQAPKVPARAMQEAAPLSKEHFPEVAMPSFEMADLFHPGERQKVTRFAEADQAEDYEDVLSSLAEEESDDPEWMLAQASALFQVQRISEANALLDEVQRLYPGSRHAQDAEILQMSAELEFGLDLPPAPTKPVPRPAERDALFAALVETEEALLSSSKTTAPSPPAEDSEHFGAGGAPFPSSEQGPNFASPTMPREDVSSARGAEGVSSASLDEALSSAATDTASSGGAQSEDWNLWNLGDDDDQALPDALDALDSLELPSAQSPTGRQERGPQATPTRPPSAPVSVPLSEEALFGDLEDAGEFDDLLADIDGFVDSLELPAFSSGTKASGGQPTQTSASTPQPSPVQRPASADSRVPRTGSLSSSASLQSGASVSASRSTGMPATRQGEAVSPRRRGPAGQTQQPAARPAGSQHREAQGPMLAVRPTPPPRVEPTLGGLPLALSRELEGLLERADALRELGERAQATVLLEQILSRAPESRYAKDARMRMLSDSIFFGS